MQYPIRKTLGPSQSQLEPLSNAFERFSRNQVPGLAPESEDKPFLFSVEQNGQLLAGICGNVYWQGLSIDILWVTEELRNQGIGTRLVRTAENFAAEYDAVVAYLKTTEATAFYQKLGYEIFGVLEDRPPGTRLYHMKKRFAP
ncbi:MAG: GNAT family N-acetyltransferase [Pseudomonadota bacterium]